MLSERLSVLIDSIGASNTDIARLADCAPSYISRLRSGERSPKRNTDAMERLAEAVYSYSSEHSVLDVLCRTMDIPEGTEVSVPMIINWLYAESGEYDNTVQDSAEKMRIFVHKLDMLINIAGISNKRLSSELGVDPSYISRIRNGSRNLKRQSKILTDMCNSIGRYIYNHGQIHRLAELAGMSPEGINFDNVGSVAFSWLTDSSSGSEIVSVRRLIDSIANLSPDRFKNVPSFRSVVPPSVIYSEVKSYRGIRGIRNASIRFLGNAVRNGAKELFFYSNQSAEWMMGEFQTLWQSLMAECIKHRISIKIIHHIERDSSEMLSEIENWLPMYTCGLVKSYFCTLSAGDMFGRSIFLAPGSACIESCCVRGFEDSCEYRYITDKENLAELEKEYRRMLEVSKPLVKYESECIKIPPHALTKKIDNVEIGAADSMVIINRRFEPRGSFIFESPRMYGAFRKFLE